MNNRAKACRQICPTRTRGERIECRIKGPCEPWRQAPRYIENERRNKIEAMDATKPTKECEHRHAAMKRDGWKICWWCHEELFATDNKEIYPKDPNR
jgi:hypothetical protein